MRRRLFSLCLVLVCVLGLFAGCGEEQAGSDFYIYYLDIDYAGIVPVAYEMEAKDAGGQIQEVVDMLSRETRDVEYMKTIPSDVKVEGYQLDQGTLSVYFNTDYGQLETYTEVMVRAAVVKTLLQIPGVDSVTFYVGSNPLQDSTGQLVGAMDNNSFIDDFGEETESLLRTTLTLYYASADGKSLVKEEKEVYYSSNVPLERLVIEYLMKTPDTEGAQSVFSSGTKFSGVSVTDGVCYVNLDANFLTQSGNITEDVAIYSIVDSLTELDQISRVQFVFSGRDNQVSLTGNPVPDNKIYERNLSLLRESETEEEE